MQRGAFNYLQKPLDLKQLRIIALKAAKPFNSNERMPSCDNSYEKFGFEGVVGQQSQMNAVIERLKRIAPTDASVLIQGETGTGKELVAQATSTTNSPRKEQAFCRVELCRTQRNNPRERALWPYQRGVHGCQL